MVLVLSSGRGESGVFVRRGAALAPVAMWPGLEHLSCAIRRMTDALGLAAGSSVRRSRAPGVVQQRFGWLRGVGRSPLSCAGMLRRGLSSTSAASRRWWRRCASSRDHQPLMGFSTCTRSRSVSPGRCLLLRLQPQRRGYAGPSREHVRSAARRAGRRRGVQSRAAGGDRPQSSRTRDRGAGTRDRRPRDRRSDRRQRNRRRDVETLALGPELSEAEIERALENCRLDYVYEPDWTRLTARVSRMLERGTIFAWFQGPTGFGPRSIGTRSVLADPSNRYARENVNRFLRHGSIDDALPVSMTAAAMDESLAGPAGSPFLTVDALVRDPWRDRLRAALDGRQSIPVQMATDEQSPALFSLLNAHRDRTSIPGLINIPLSGAGETAACAPRDAIRTMSLGSDRRAGDRPVPADEGLLAAGAEPTHDRHPRDLGVLSRQRRGAGRRRRDRRRGAGGAVHAARSTIRRFRHAPSSMPGRGGADAGRSRLRRLLREAASQVRAAARDLPRLRAARASAASAWPCRSGSRRSCTCARTIREGLGEPTQAPLVFTDHHESHAASAFFPSPFDEAAILTLDGVGEWSTTTHRASARATRIDADAPASQFPHSLGLLYSAFTYYCGFKVNSGEYKLMGLAPYGQPDLQGPDPRAPDRPQARRQLLARHGVLQLLPGADDDRAGGSTSCSAARRGDPESTLEQRHMDLAASIQAVTEEVDAAHRPARPRADRHEATWSWPAAWR